MIDTKIACQCGNRFKFGMDLVKGRAPEGLACPTCGTPVTPACNALVEFLSGTEPAPPSTSTRPVKEIKVTCACGARYKFDLELAEREMPSPVMCPGCQADLTPIANEEIRGYIAKHAPGLAAPLAATTPVAAAAPPAAEPTPAPPAPAPAPAPPSPAAPDITPAAAPPAAPSPVAAPIAAAAADSSSPAPTGKTSGPNLKPLEAPKQNRPAPGTKPADLPAKPSAPVAATTNPAKPTTAKPVAVPASPPAKASGQPSLGMGIAGAAAGALLGSALWFALLKFTSMSAGWMAPVVGALAGFGARLLGRTTAPALGGAACVCATLAIGLMSWLVMLRHIDRQLAPQMKTQYATELATAQAAAKATDAELKLIIARASNTADMQITANVSDEEVKAYRATKLPALRDFASGKPSRETWEANKRASLRAYYPLEDAWQESIGIFGLLSLLAGIMAAAKIPMK
ncbi:MAG: hypothetical protein HZA92_15990 [Verrucomicrobia bacterium]|nr:hypothetical protein [Verrucomicrobiota bacterium]